MVLGKVRVQDLCAQQAERDAANRRVALCV